MAQQCYLIRDEHIPERPRFVAVDAHNHLWGNWASVADVVATMDACGIAAYCDLTANIAISWGAGGYILGLGSFAEFLHNTAAVFPGRFYGFTAATFAAPTDAPLFTNATDFVARTVDLLREHVANGARGLKILKELGLHYRDGDGRLIAVDEPRLDPIWAEAGRLGVPVLIHQSDPCGFFEPTTPFNEHYGSLQKYPSWSFSDPKFPRKAELLARRDRLVRRHPDTVFLLPHVANYAENLDYVAGLLDENPNVYIDFSARIDELGRQPYRSREFLCRYQDRVYFGTDMPASPAMYRCYFRFLETYDEYFFAPDYDGTFDRWRWPICGLGLPDTVLRKIYHENAAALIPGLRAQLQELSDSGTTPDREP